MEEKKEFNIPKNFKSEFEMIQGVKLKDLLFFIPSTILILITAFLIPLLPIYKIIIIAFLIFIPFSLVFIKPIEGRDIAVWQILKYKYDFMKRQKEFHYRKGGWEVENQSDPYKTKINSSRKK